MPPVAAKNTLKRAGSKVVEQNLAQHAANEDAAADSKLGYLFFSQDKFQEASVHLNRSVALGTSDARLWHTLGTCFFKIWQAEPDEIQRLEQAYDAYSRGMTFLELVGNPDFHFEITRIYEGFGNFEAAAATFGHLISNYPKYQPMQTVLRSAIVCKYMALKLTEPMERWAALEQALEYMTHVVDGPPAGWTEDDLMMQIARLYELIPGEHEGENLAESHSKFMLRP